MTGRSNSIGERMENASMNQPTKARILIVDAERSVAEAFEYYLGKTKPYTVRIASSAMEAQRIINESGGFELMLLDITVPGLEHIEAVQNLARLNVGGKILTITGSSRKLDRPYTLNSRNVRALSKSQPATEIVDAVIGALEGGHKTGIS